MQNALKNLGFTLTGFSGELETVEIPNPEKRKPGRYPQKGWTPTITVTRQKTSGENLTITGTPSVWSEFFKASLAEALPLMVGHNKSEAARYRRDDAERARWTGGTNAELLEALAGRPNLSPFLAAKEEVEASGMMEAIRLELESISPRRRRVWSDNGQWVEDRRFEPEAFEDFKRQASPARSVNFELQCAENCFISAEKISQFGATAWAIIDLLESAGISTGLKLVYTLDGIFPGNKTALLNVQVKDSGEYVSPSFVAGVMTSNFYRRAIFAGINALAEASGKEVSPGLGHARQFYDAATYDSKTCTLRLCSSAVDNPQRVLEQVLAAIRSLTDQAQAA